MFEVLTAVIFDLNTYRYLFIEMLGINLFYALTIFVSMGLSHII